jgi:D-alanine--D-alanine ligase
MAIDAKHKMNCFSGSETKLDFGRIAVLMGGPSSERDISFESARSVCETLKSLGLDFITIDIRTDDEQENLKLLKSCAFDCVFIALHGYFGEDGKIQKILDTLAIPYTGSSAQASKDAMDKAVSAEIFAAAGLSVPKFMLLNRKYFEKQMGAAVDFQLPWVIKPAGGGSSIGLSVIDNKDALDAAIELAFKYDERILIEEYIKGRELTVGILGEKPLSVIEIVPERGFFDFRAKYESSGTKYICPAQLDPDTARKVQEAALSAHKSLGCFGCSRVDIILNQSNVPYVLELNNIPGLTSHSLLPKAAKADGIDFSQLCVKLLSLAYEKK